MAEQKVGRPLTRIEAQRLGNYRTPPAERERLKAIQDAYLSAQRAETAKAAAETAQGAAHRPGLGIPRTGKLDRDAQSREDSFMIGRYGASVNQIRDPALRERLAAAIARKRTEREARAAITSAAALEADARTAAARAETLEAEAAKAKRQAAIDAKQSELAQATEQWRAKPTSGAAAARVRVLTAEVEQLVQQQPT